MAAIKFNKKTISKIASKGAALENTHILLSDEVLQQHFLLLHLSLQSKTTIGPDHSIFSSDQFCILAKAQLLSYANIQLLLLATESLIHIDILSSPP